MFPPVVEGFSLLPSPPLIFYSFPFPHFWLYPPLLREQYPPSLHRFLMRSPTFARKRVGNYELGETLGEGTFGKVRRALHLDSGKSFAIKCLDKQQIEQQNMGAQLKREIAVMKMIRSENIVQFYECLASKSNVYLVLELITGGELFELLVKERRFTEDRARFFFRQLVMGVQCCHKKGIAHRDLKVSFLQPSFFL